MAARRGGGRLAGRPPRMSLSQDTVLWFIIWMPSNVLLQLLWIAIVTCGAVGNEALDEASACVEETSVLARSLDDDYDYIIIGGGAAGIQMGLFLQQQPGVRYVIYEKGPDAGTFWRTYPVTEELISVNTPHAKRKDTNDPGTGGRYEWHGLLGTSVPFKSFSTRYFPLRSEYRAYLNHVVAAEALNVRFNVDVARLLAGDGGPCVVLAPSGDKVCARRRIFVATGLQPIPRPRLDAMGVVNYTAFNRSMVDGERVCIFGNGNSAWEIAQASIPTAEAVSVIGRRPTRWSFVTKYTGDVRIKYAQALENFNSKLLGFTTRIITEGARNDAEVLDAIQELVDDAHNARASYEANKYLCTVLFHAWGFRSTLLPIEKKTKNDDDGQGAAQADWGADEGRGAADNDDDGGYEGIFPADLDIAKGWYASRSLPRVHYIGWHMHKLDFMQGAGGFASGFRYLIRNLWQHVQEEEEEGRKDALQAEQQRGTQGEKPIDDDGQLLLSMVEVAERVHRRISGADDIVIMQDGKILRDVIELARPPSAGCGFSSSDKRWRYVEGANYNFLPPERRAAAATLHFAWGNNSRDARTVLNERYFVKTDSGDEVLRNILLHPVVEWRGFQVHLCEQPLNNWGPHNAIDRLTRDIVSELLPIMVQRSPHCAAENENENEEKIALSKRWIRASSLTASSNDAEDVSPGPAEHRYLDSMKWGRLVLLEYLLESGLELGVQPDSHGASPARRPGQNT